MYGSRNSISLGLAMLVACLITAPLALAAEPTAIRVLILTGQNNHAWQETTPLLKMILTSSGRFAVDVTEHPEQCSPDVLSKYDLVLSNWNELGKVKDWPATTKDGLLEFVRSGHGFVVVHAGGTMFHDWTEFQKMIGATWGQGTGHGPKHEFEVKLSDVDHPITRGLSNFKIADELWHRMLAQPEKRVLATALSETQWRGTGNEEPMVMVTDFGRGRCFNLVLGHDTGAMENLGFQSLLLRGSEWAATGKVTIPPCVRLARPAADAAIHAVAGYKVGQSKRDVVALERLVGAVSSDVAESRAMAAKLAAAMESSATPDCKLILCQQLALVGTAAEVPVLVRHLGDGQLGQAAQFALERIPGDASLAALRDALKTADGKAKAGVIQALAVRRDERSVPAIAGMIASPDRTTAVTALLALGQLGSNQAEQALTAAEAKLSAELRPVLSEALLHCAARRQEAGQAAEALALYEKLMAGGHPKAVRTESLIARARLLGPKGNALILEALTGSDATLQTAAVAALRARPDDALLQAIVGRFDSLAPLIQPAVIAIFAEREIRSAAPAVARAAASKKPPIRRAALAAIGVLGDASHVPVLLGLVGTADPDEVKLIGQSLGRLCGPGVNESLLATLDCPNSAVRCQTIRALETRGAVAAVPRLLALSREKDGAVAREAMSAIGKLGSLDDAMRLVAQLDKDAESSGALTAIGRILRRTGGPEPLIAMLPKVSAEQKPLLLGVLRSVGGEKSYQAVRAALEDPAPAVRQVAIETLAGWPDSTPLEDLVAVAEKTSDEKSNILALRGVAQMAPLVKDRQPWHVTPLVAKAMTAARRPEEAKLLLASLGRFQHGSAVNFAAKYLRDPMLGNDAAMAIAQIYRTSPPWNRGWYVDGAMQARAACTDAAIKARFDIPLGEDLVSSAAAKNLDSASGIRVRLKEPSAIWIIRITGPKQPGPLLTDFEVVCDGKVVKRVSKAEYQDNRLTLGMGPTPCTELELRLPASQGARGAIGQLEIYGQAR